MKNMFNLSMTYRHDSDIHMPYGYIVPRKGEISNMHAAAESLVISIIPKLFLLVSIDDIICMA